MVVSFIAHTEQIRDLEDRLSAAQVDDIYEEKVANDEAILSIRPSSLEEARYLAHVGYRAGALQIDIDQDAA